MLKLAIPGFSDNLLLEHLVLDFNGTLAIDGKLIDGVVEKLIGLSETFSLHVITGNTYGTAQDELKNIPCKTVLLPIENQAMAKEKYVRQLDPHTVIGIGNGRNDRLMLKIAEIGIALIQKEGAAAETIMAADIVCPDIFSALDLISNPMRLVATLRY